MCSATRYNLTKVYCMTLPVAMHYTPRSKIHAAHTDLRHTPTRCMTRTTTALRNAAFLSSMIRYHPTRYAPRPSPVLLYLPTNLLRHLRPAPTPLRGRLPGTERCASARVLCAVRYLPTHSLRGCAALIAPYVVCRWDIGFAARRSGTDISYHATGEVVLT
eukprot:661251-Rhodomonas_salina.2